MRIFKGMKKNADLCETRKTLIIDLNNAVYKAVYAHPTLSSKGKYTGGLYGVLSQIKKAIFNTRATEIVICNDFPPYIRSEFTEYKQRDRDQEISKKITETRNLCKKFFKLLNIAIWEIKGMESDDLIASLSLNVINNKNLLNKVFILSGDSDLFQCLEDERVTLIKNNGVFYTGDDFRKNYGMSPSKWAWVSALSGGHNGLPGFEGIGEKKALEIAKNDKRLFQFIQEHPKVLLYHQMSKLPLFEIKEIPEITSPKKQNFLKAELFLKNLNFKVE